MITADDVIAGLCLEYYEDDKARIRDALADKRVVYFEVQDENYESSACLVARGNDGGWWFWEAGHCSCNGYEDWGGLERSHPAALLAKGFWSLTAEAVHAAVRAEMEANP